SRQMQGQGISLDDYFKFTGTNVEDFANNLKPDVEKNIKIELVLSKIADEEKIDVTEEELDKEIKVFADAYQQDFDEYKKTVNEQMTDYLKANVKRRKAIELLVDSAKVK
ncbi:MAG: trigger factor, partial [Eubacterium sp.]